MRALPRRRPEVVFLASILVFVTLLTTRIIAERVSVPVVLPVGTRAPMVGEPGDARMIADLQARIRQDPENTDAYALLGLALLQRVRETGDSSLYTQAELAFDAALQRDPQHLDALLGKGALALSRHQFAEALRWGEQARAINPQRAEVYGIIGDAQVELGRYDAATATVQRMVELRPDLSSYSRVAYLRELYGDTAGAIDAMQRAVAAGNPVAEGTLWAQVQLGNLSFNSGDLPQAERTYRRALRIRPDYAYALAGVARVRAARGDYAEAIRQYEQIVERLPLPEFVIALGELYEHVGQERDAESQYELVRAMQQLNASAGMDVDLELALFDADHSSDPTATVIQARAAYERRPSIYAADTLAWALYRSGDYTGAWRYSQEALRLGTRDALLHYHAGMIADALGEDTAASDHLRQALAINPFFSVRYAAPARAMLVE